MPNQWFRMYSEFADDPKVQMMPETFQRRLLMLFCERCKCETLHETQRAFHWRISPDELAQTKAAFVANGFIDEMWNVLNWNKRQYISDSSTDRVRRFRQGLKQDETFHVTPCSVTETQGNVSVTAPEQNRTDTEQNHKQPKQPRKRVIALEVPDWIDHDSWTGFVEMRQKMRKPLTERAKAGVIKKLETLRDQGEDPSTCLDTATLKNWLLPYAPNGTGGNNNHDKERRDAIIQEFVARSGTAGGKGGIFDYLLVREEAGEGTS